MKTARFHKAGVPAGGPFAVRLARLYGANKVVSAVSSLAFLAAAGCGRRGFDDVLDSSGGPPAYHDIQPVYITGYAIPPLVPTGGREPWTITPPLPAGLAIDRESGDIAGTPEVPSSPALYTVSTPAGDTTIGLRTADGFVVNDGGDAPDATPGDDRCEVTTGSNLCTLRAVVQEINASKGKHVVFIAVRTVTLAITLPAFAAAIELVGMSPAATTIDANHVGPLAIGANGVSLTLSYLTYRNNAGELAHNYRTNLSVVVDHAELRDDDGLLSLPGGATARLVDSTFSNNANRLVNFSGSTLTIERCTFAENAAADTQLLYFVSGTVLIENSTFSGNTGMYSPVLFNNASATVRNSTFVSNTATMQDQGGAVTVYSGGTAVWTNCMLVNNVSPRQSCHAAGAMISTGGNLVWPPETDSGSCNFELSFDPLLEPLADNGGPTPTHALSANSGAVDAATSDCPASDQRGVARPQGNGCDIGAFERE